MLNLHIHDNKYNGLIKKNKSQIAAKYGWFGFKIKFFITI